MTSQVAILAEIRPGRHDELLRMLFGSAPAVYALSVDRYLMPDCTT